ITERRELRTKLRAINTYDGLFFTSPVSARVFVEEFAKLRVPFQGRTYALGTRAISELKAGGFEPHMCDEANTVSELLGRFGPGEFSTKRFLFVRGDRSLRTIPEQLAEIASVDEVVVYRTSDVLIDPEARGDISLRLNGGTLEWVCVFSPSAVESFVRQLPAAKDSAAKFAAIGDTTGTRARELGLEIEFISERANSEDFAAELMEYINEIE
ncbi:MAG: uroporphyrinogen-III synthase, partial [Acidobacteria bacterium]|nr:uroporphyrinogen-III synthase [Acidobacteriota bacterium]